MIRTSRCFDVNSFQLGGSDTLVSVGCFDGNLPFVDFWVRTLPILFGYEIFCSFVESPRREYTRLRASRSKGERAAHLIAAA